MTASLTPQRFILDAGFLSAAAVIGIVAEGALASELPDSIDVTGIVRDFKERTDPDGHPDMEKRPDHGFARYSGNVALDIGPDRKPVFTGLGHKVASQYRDSEWRQICYALYDASLGDQEGSWSQAGTGGITSADTYNQWYNDVPGVNMSAPLSITLVRDENNHYVFDDELDAKYIPLGGFFPIEHQLFGNPGGNPDRNFHFTFELHLEFEYDETIDPFFMFTGDDDVWVYINDKLVIDLGGVHAAHDQYVDMTRLNLTDGETYVIDFFYAERHRTTSNFRIETNLPVRTLGLPPTTAAFD